MLRVPLIAGRSWLFPVGPFGDARLTVEYGSFVGSFDIEIQETVIWDFDPHKTPSVETKMGTGSSGRSSAWGRRIIRTTVPNQSLWTGQSGLPQGM